MIDADPDDLAPDARVATFPLQLRKRGVETKITLSDAPAGIDETPIRNIADALAWFERIKAGETFARIAETETTSKRCTQQMIGLAFLAPDIVRDVMAGKQPLGFTSVWCLRHSIPSDWTDQRTLISVL